MSFFNNLNNLKKGIPPPGMPGMPTSMSTGMPPSMTSLTPQGIPPGISTSMPPQGMSSLTKIPGMPSLTKIPGNLSMPKMPGIPNLSGMPNLASKAAGDLKSSAISAPLSVLSKISNREITDCVITEFCKIFNDSEEKMKNNLKEKIDVLLNNNINIETIDTNKIIKNIFTKNIYEILNKETGKYNFQHAFIQYAIQNNISNIDLKTNLNKEIEGTKTDFLNRNFIVNEEKILNKSIDFLKENIKGGGQKGGGEYDSQIMDILSFYDDTKPQEKKINYTVKKIFKNKLQKVLSDDVLIHNFREKLKSKLSEVINTQLQDQKDFDMIKPILYYILKDNNSLKRTFKNGIKKALNKKYEKEKDNKKLNNDQSNAVMVSYIPNILNSFKTDEFFMTRNPMNNTNTESSFDNITLTNKEGIKENYTENILKDNKIINPPKKCLKDEIHNIFTSFIKINTTISSLNDTLDQSIGKIFDNVIKDENINIKNIIESKISTIIYDILNNEDYKQKIFYLLIDKILDLYKNKNNKITIDFTKNPEEIFQSFLDGLQTFIKPINPIKSSGGAKDNREIIVNIFKNDNRVNNFEYSVKSIIKEKIEKYIFSKSIEGFFNERFLNDLKIIVDFQLSIFVEKNHEILTFYFYFTLMNSELLKKICIIVIKEMKNSGGNSGDFVILIEKIQNKLKDLITKLDEKINAFFEKNRIKETIPTSNNDDEKGDGKQKGEMEKVAAMMAAIEASKSKKEIDITSEKVAAITAAISKQIEDEATGITGAVIEPTKNNNNNKTKVNIIPIENIIENSGGGDCFFLSVVDALKESHDTKIKDFFTKKFNDIKENYKGKIDFKSKQFDVAFLRNIVSYEITNNNFEEYINTREKEDEQYFNDFLKKNNKQEILNNKEEIIKKKELFKEYFNSKFFWAENNSLSIIQNILNIKLIIYYSQTKKYGGPIWFFNGEKIKNQPDYYMFLNYSGNHYKLITYNDKTLFKLDEIPTEKVNKLCSNDKYIINNYPDEFTSNCGFKGGKKTKKKIFKKRNSRKIFRKK